jgi:hypothetical protein
VEDTLIVHAFVLAELQMALSMVVVDEVLLKVASSRHASLDFHVYPVRQAPHTDGMLAHARACDLDAHVFLVVLGGHCRKALTWRVQARWPPGNVAPYKSSQAIQFTTLGCKLLLGKMVAPLLQVPAFSKERIKETGCK